MLNKLSFNVDKWSIKIGEVNTSYENFNRLDKNMKCLAHLKPNHVKDRKAMFIADPFVIEYQNKWYCFYEILDNCRYEGVIGYSESVDGCKWIYGGICLEEDWHLSYPYVFKDKDNIYMIPESANSKAITLYKAKVFPNKWEKIKNIIEGEYFDSSICFYNDKWWIFTMKENNLYIFYSDNIEGPWLEHKKNPIISNNKNITRPGGRIISLNNKLIRHTQDCNDNYGKLVRQYEIINLTIDEYKEREIGIVIKNSDKKLTWNRDGMHNIDIQEVKGEKCLIAIDGYYCKKVNRIINKAKKIINMKAY